MDQKFASLEAQFKELLSASNATRMALDKSAANEAVQQKKIKNLELLVQTLQSQSTNTSSAKPSSSSEVEKIGKEEAVELKQRGQDETVELQKRKAEDKKKQDKDEKARRASFYDYGSSAFAARDTSNNNSITGTAVTPIYVAPPEALPEYDGKSDPKVFLAKFTLAADKAGWNNNYRLMMFSSCLTGYCKEFTKWIDTKKQSLGEQPLDFKVVADKFLLTYEKRDITVDTWAQLNTIKKKKPESIEQYSMRFDTLCLQLLEYPVESQQVIMLYLGLPDVYRKKIQMREHNTVQSLIKHAKEVERKLETEESVNKASNATRHVSTVTRPAKSNYKNNKPKDKRLSDEDYQRAIKERLCLYCLKPNHSAQECRKRKHDIQHGGPKPYVSGQGNNSKYQKSDPTDSSKSKDRKEHKERKDHKHKAKVAALQADQIKDEPKKESTTSKSKADSKKTCLIFKEDRNELLFVPFNSGTLKVAALIDTGADISIISPDCLSNVKITKERRIELDVQVASSSTIKVNKEVEVEFKVGETVHKHWFTVLHSALFGIILGWDFWGAFNPFSISKKTRGIVENQNVDASRVVTYGNNTVHTIKNTRKCNVVLVNVIKSGAANNNNSEVLPELTAASDAEDFETEESSDDDVPDLERSSDDDDSSDNDDVPELEKSGDDDDSSDDDDVPELIRESDLSDSESDSESDDDGDSDYVPELESSDLVNTNDIKCFTVAASSLVPRTVENSDLEKLVEKSNCSTSEKLELINLLVEFKDIFQHDLFTAGASTVEPIKVELTNPDMDPIKCRPYRASPKEVEVMRKLVDEMIKTGVAKPTMSRWAAPMLVVGKKDGSYRPVIDYRKVNEATVKKTWPIPRIDDIWNDFEGKTCFSKFDCNKGYWQMKLDESSQEILAFSTPFGNFAPLVLPMGTTNAVAEFQKAMQEVMKNNDWNFLTIYIDDIFVYSDNFQDHINHLRITFTALRDKKIYLKISKCEFMPEVMEVMGHGLSKEGICINGPALKSIKEITNPSNLKELRSIMGLFSYYRKFIEHYTELSEPMNMLLRKDVPFRWTKDKIDALAAMKQAFCDAGILIHPDFKKKFILSTDASLVGIGAVVEQELNGELRPVRFSSKSLNDAQRNWDTTERECWSVVYHLKEFRHLLLGNLEKVVTDHNALKWLIHKSDATGKLARWQASLVEYNPLTVEYRPGTENVVADSLSRPPCVNVVSALVNNNLATDAWLDDLKAEPFYESIIEELETGGSVGDEFSNYVMNEGKLYRIWHNPTNKTATRLLLVVPKERREALLYSYHDNKLAGHLGFVKCFEKLRNDYWWPGMFSDVKKWVLACDACQMSADLKVVNAGPTKPIVITKRNELVSVDLVGPLVETDDGNKYILVTVDHFTRWPTATPIKDKQAVTVALKLIEIFCTFGFPKEMLSDQGTEFVNNIQNTIQELLGVGRIFTTAGHPATNGKVERVNRVIKSLLRRFVSVYGKGNDWDKWLPTIMFAIRTAINNTTKTSPWALTFGEEARQPTVTNDISDKVSVRSEENVVAELKEKLKEFNEWAVEVQDDMVEKSRQRRDNDRSKLIRKNNFKVGELVLVNKGERESGILPKWFGPYRIIEVHDNNTLTLKGKTKITKLNIERVKLYKDPTSGLDEELEGEIAEIINERDRETKDGSKVKEFLVQWRGSTRQDLEWIAEKDLNAEEVIKLWKFRSANSKKESEDKIEIGIDIDEEDALRDEKVEVDEKILVKSDIIVEKGEEKKEKTKGKEKEESEDEESEVERSDMVKAKSDESDKSESEEEKDVYTEKSKKVSKGEKSSVKDSPRRSTRKPNMRRKAHWRTDWSESSSIIDGLKRKK